jgi:hypothetical protein
MLTGPPGRVERVLLRSGPDQCAIPRHVPDRVLRLLEFFVQQRQVVVAFGHAWIGGKRRLVRLHRLRLAIHVIEQHAQVVEQHWVAAAGFHRLAIDLLGLRVAAGFVQKPSQVYIGIEKRRIGGDGLLVRPN